MPGWFGYGRPGGDLRELVACQNGIWRSQLASCGLTPRYWSPNVLDFAYNPRAEAPRFEQFLDEVWPGDDDAQQCLLEMFGLCLTDVTKYQKAFMFVGPRRGGRGTIGRVLRGLIGSRNYIGTSLKAFSESFGMENFIGKKVAVFSDARLDGVLQRNLSTIVERLLLITGEDEMHINRKNTKYWEGKLTSRVVVFSNELLRLPDESGALPGRFLTFRMQQSFYGREDPNLTDKLLAERPGILNLALDALERLRSRGRLIQCASGAEMSESLGELSSDLSVFVEAMCVVGPEHQVLCGKLFEAFQSFCAQRNVRHAWGEPQFSEKLRSVVPTITTSRPRKDNPKRLTMLIGIGLRPNAKPKRIGAVLLEKA
jgi:putative DNA primase/helicase